MRLILASQSSSRRALMERSGLNFEVIPSDYDEDYTLSKNPLELVKALALGKARDVAGKVIDGIIIGADSMVLLNGELIGKPRDKAEAYKHLRKLLGNTHSLITGLAVINKDTNEEVTDVSETLVTFRSLSEDELNDYLNRIDYTKFAGAYAIDYYSMLFVESINGEYSNVVGLPMNKLALILKSMGLKVF